MTPSEPAALFEAGVPAGTAMGAPANPILRYVTALRRYKWIVLGVAALGVAAGLYAMRFTEPEYTVRSTLWIETGGSKQGQDLGGPLRSGELLESSAWVELLRSYEVLDYVVREERLFLKPKTKQDKSAIRSLSVKDRFRPGAYRLTVDERGQRYTLVTGEGLTAEEGVVGDSVGRKLGFGWRPTKEMLPPERVIAFTLLTPRDASVELNDQLQTILSDKEGNFLRLELKGSDPEKIASVMNALTRRYIDVATELKRAKMMELANVLSSQLDYAARNLKDEESAFERFRVQTITLPTDRGMAVAPGIQVTKNPVFENFFALRVEKEQIRRDREALAQATSPAAGTGFRAGLLEGIPAVQRSSPLTQALRDLTSKQAELRVMKNQFTDLYAPVKRLSEEVDNLQTRTIPGLVNGLQSELAARESSVDALIQSASGQLRDIPPRAIEETRRERRVEIASNLFRMLQQRYEEARLAAVTSFPDVRVLDRATVPYAPSSDPRIMFLMMFSLGGLGVAVLGVLAFDRINPKLVYPEQVTGGLGLAMLGAIPAARRQATSGAGGTAHLLEAFRSLRLNVAHASGAATPLVLTISSPGSGEGKSFVSVNLALSFAEQGHRTLLIDGDLRRGTIHHLLNCNRKPGLTDLLQETAPRGSVIQATAYPLLHVIGSGTRTHAGPELLGSAAMAELLADLKTRYRVILIDSPPMGACADPLVLGTLTRDMIIVLRTDITSRAVAQTNLEMLDRLPVRVLGAVVNGTVPNGLYRAYEYLSGYEIADAEDRPVPERTKQLQGV